MEKLSRRNALRLAAAAAAGAVLAACGLDATPTPTATPTRPARPRVTPTLRPPERAAAIPTSVPGIEINNESGQEQINIPQETLDFLRRQIKDSGLSTIIRRVEIKAINDPIFTTPKESGYPHLVTVGGLKKPSAIAVGFDNPKEGITLYLANTTINKTDVAHELGHSADPRLNRAILFAVTDFDNEYFQKHFYPYLARLRTNEPILEPYLFPYEKQIVMGTAIDIGEKCWSAFVEKLSTPMKDIKGATPFFIPNEKLQEIAKTLLQNSIQRKALEWYLGELSTIQQADKTPELKGFSYEAWGSYLMRSYFDNPSKTKDYLPNLYPEIEKSAKNAFNYARYEVWADLWAERVTNPDNARQLYPLGVQTQEQVISFLKKK